MKSLPNTDGLKTKEVLAAIKLFVKANGYSPTVRELMPLAKLKSPASVFYHINLLRNSGKLTFSEGKSRVMRVIGL